VTAYVLQLNGLDAGPVLNAETATKIRLAPDLAVASLGTGTASSGTEAAQAAVESPASSATPLLMAGAFAVILLFAGGVFLRRKGVRQWLALPGKY
jgi:hypothetical protein